MRQVAEYYGEYKQCFEGAGTNVGEKTLEDKFFEYEVRLNVNAFMQQFHYGVFYSFLKLKEQVLDVIYIVLKENDFHKRLFRSAAT